jgi:hypothetical protein
MFAAPDTVIASRQRGRRTMANVSPPAGARARPAVVTYACYLLYLLAVLQILSAVVQFAVAGIYSDVMKKAFAGTDAAGVVSTTTTIGVVVGGVVALLFAVGYVVLAIFDGRGKQPARIVTWVLLGLSLCCGGSALVSSTAGGLGFGGNTGSTPGAPSQAELQQMLKDGLPGWYQPTSLVLGVLAVLVAIGVIVLLALPAAHPFFRKQQPAWEPPMPGATWEQPGQQPPATWAQPGQQPPATWAQPGQQPPATWAQPGQQPPAPPAPPVAGP